MIDFEWCIYVSVNKANFGSNYGMLPVQRQAIISTNFVL